MLQPRNEFKLRNNEITASGKLGTQKVVRHKRRRIVRQNAVVQHGAQCDGNCLKISSQLWN